MISLKRAKEIAVKDFSEYPISEIIDIGSRWAFCFDSGEPPVPGIPAVTVSKEDGCNGVNSKTKRAGGKRRSGRAGKSWYY